MSGGFFRGTSADQDTRFSNKQAKLLKTQKFAPELEHLVDITKVKMDVIKPWIAKRVTELLGFEDEVLINFIYGLLEGKEVNGKQVQIHLTGFMEKNTGKFMKELWALLLSAQKNASGVPQQFLDAKEEETRKKKEETDRIFNEIQRRKEKETKESEQEKTRKMDGGLENNSAVESHKRPERGSDTQFGDENGAGVTNGVRGRNRSSRSPYSSDRSPSPHRGAPSRSRSKSYSHSRSYSKERSMSRSVSGSPRAKKLSVSPERRRRSPRRSVSPRRRSTRESISPRRRSHSGRRSSPYTRYRSPTPVRRRVRRRSPSPVRRRSRSPLRRRSPSPWRRRSPSPWRRRSPSPRRRRSPSPLRRRRQRSTSSSRSRSPVQRRPLTPVRRRSPVGRRSPYLARRRSPSLDRRGSPSPRGRRSRSLIRRRSPSPIRRRLPVATRRRSPTPSPSRSPSPASGSSGSPVRHRSVSPVKMKSTRLQKSPRGSPRETTRNHEAMGTAMMARRQPISLSPQRDHSERNRSRKDPSVSPSPDKSPNYSESPRIGRSSGENRRLASSFESPGKKDGAGMTLDAHPSPPTKSKDHKVRHSGTGRSPGRNEERMQNISDNEENKYKSTERGSARSSGDKKREHDRPASGRHHGSIDLRQKDSEMRSEEVPVKEAHALNKSAHKGSVHSEKPDISYPGDGSKSTEKRSSLSKDARDNSKSDPLVNPNRKVERSSPSVDSDSGSEGSERQKAGVAEKRKHRRSSRRGAASDGSSSEFEMEDRKEAKRRRKDEKKLRKEERRRRREERRRRKEEKRASKRKRKSKDADASSSDISDMEKHEKDDNASNVKPGTKTYSSEDEDTESRKKRLEIELREKALESLRAKKGISR